MRALDPELQFNRSTASKLFGALYDMRPFTLKLKFVDGELGINISVGLTAYLPFHIFASILFWLYQDVPGQVLML